MFWNFWKNRRVNRERILALDLLRGTFLVEIITAHVAWHPSIFTFISGGNQLEASAAEGFFTISGMLVGYLYAPRVLKDTKKVFIKIWKRAGLLWFLATFFTLLYTAWGIISPSQTYLTLYEKSGISFLFNTFTLRYAFGWAEFLNRYAVFMLLAPFAVWLIAKGRAWIVVLISFSIWFFLRKNEYFLPFSAWQVIFMNAIILGYYLPHIEDWFKSLAKQKQRLLFISIVSVAFVSYVFSILFFLVGPLVLPASDPIVQARNDIMPYFSKDYIEAGRFLVGVLWFAALYMVYRRYEKSIAKLSRGALEVLGRQSLFVYSFHGIILFIIDLYLAPTPDHNLWQNTLVTLAVMLIVYIAAYNRVQVSDHFRKLYKNRTTTQVP